MDPAKPAYVSNTTPRADGTIVHLALRDLHAFLGRPRFWAILAGASVVVALAGPFYTLERLSFPARLIYWGGTGLGSCVLLTFLSILMRRIAAVRGWHWLPGAVLTGVVGILPTMALVYVANRVSVLDTGPAEFWSLFPYVSGPVVLITVLINAVVHDPAVNAVQSAQTDAVPVDPATPLLFAKLPASLGRDIVSIQAKDHYIEVTTPKGSALILMRLSDAEQDLSALDGLRVHRSWWVNFAHVERIEKGVSGPELRLSTGQSAPVARGQRAAVRAAIG